jgi:hypothetical protein
MRTSGRIVKAIAVLFLMWAGLASSVSFASTALAPSPTSPEYMIKAAYLLNFARLIEWPGDAFATRSSPITIGVLGSDPFGQGLDLTVEGKKISNRQILVKRLQWGQDLRQCQIVFISAADSSRIGELASRVGGLPVLIVSEGTDLAKRGATINFSIEDDRVRFEVNVEAAKRARLNISSQVLRVARIVKDL